MGIETGTGKAWFNESRTKRYFIERNWKSGDKILGSILMNPSRADAIKNDATIELLIDYAINNHYDGMCVVNIIPIIEPDSTKLSDVQVVFEAVKDDEQKEAFMYMLNKCEDVYVGWGGKGNKYFHYLFEGNNSEEIKELKAVFNKSKFFATYLSSKGYPFHPKQRNKNTLKNNSELIDVTTQIKQMIT
mgnify:CR=1 FL=1